MADEIVATQSPTGDTTAPTAGLSMSDIAKGIMNTGTAKGAALGALFTELLRQSSSGQGVAKPLDMSKYAIPGRETTVAAPRFVPYAEYGARDVPAISDEAMRSFGAPTGLGSLMPTSQYTARPEMASRAPLTISSAGSGRNVMPTLSITPRSTTPISPLTGALLGGAMGYLMTPETDASRTGAQAMGNLYNLAASGLTKGAGALLDYLKGSGSTAGGNVGADLPVGSPGFGSAGEGYYQQDGKTYALMPNGQTRLVYDPSTAGNTVWDPATGGSAGYYDPNQFGGDTPSYTLPSDYSTTPYQPPYTYQPTLSGGSLYGDYYKQPPSFVEPDISYGYDDSGYYGWKDGGMATPMMAGGGQVPEPSFYTYGTVVDPMQMISGVQNTGMAGGGMAHGGLHVPTVEGRHDYRAGSRVMGPGDGQSDDIPAMLADGEYVIDAETVAQLGNGSSKAGSDMLDKFREEIRAHKRSAPVNKIPPASKSPLQYLKQAQSRSKKNG